MVATTPSVETAPQPDGTPRVGFRARLGWAFYDWAAQPYFTIIFTFVFGPYFVAHVASDVQTGQTLWAGVQTWAGVLMALLAPLVGAYADVTGPRKPGVIGCSAICIVACALLWFAVPGADAATLWLILVALVLGTVGAEFAIVFNNAMLPELAGPAEVGRLSGFGWAMGYAGGLLALPVMLWVTGQLPGFDGPGLDGAAHTGDRLAGPFVALWFSLFMLPFLLWTPDTGHHPGPRVGVAAQSLRAAWDTLRLLPARPNLLRYLLARMAYYDGLNAIFAFGGVYAAVRFGWGTTELGLFGIIILLFGVPGCFLGGWLDDRIGARRTLLIAVSGLFLTMLGILSIGEGRILFALPVAFPQADDGLFGSSAEHFMIALAALLGVCAGPAQSASRTLIARLAPPEERGRFFGLFALSGKATSFVAPASIGILLGVVGDRWAYAVILVFIAIGLALLVGVRETADPT